MVSEQSNIKQIKSGSITTPLGFKTAGLHSGVKHKRKDLGVIYSENLANVAAVYTLNKVQAEPIKVTKESINYDDKIQAVIVNSGNANACTGEQGYKDAIDMRKTTAEHFKIEENYVAVASTGVIGEQMPMDKITPHIKKLAVDTTKESAENFAEAILTTDTFTKSVCYEAEIAGKKVTVAGVAKGSGMIEPNMGTMLAFVTTDIAIDSPSLDKALKQAVDQTFNCVTVDGDTSTNDMVLVMANGAAKNDTITVSSAEWNTFLTMLTNVCEDLAKMIARDGEGATKLVTVEIKGAKTVEDARKAAKSVVGSSLVKTAVFGSDANWGRVIAAVGYSGADFDANQVDLSFGHIPLLEKSRPVSFTEEEATAYLKNEEVEIYVNLNSGNKSGKAWGCDLTYEYVTINSSYRS